MQLVSGQRISVCGMFSHKWGIYIIYTTLRLMDYCGKGEEKSTRARGWGGPV